MKILFIILVFSLKCVPVFSQDLDSLLADFAYELKSERIIYTIKESSSFSSRKSITYEDQSNHRSIYLTLNEDSTFSLKLFPYSACYLAVGRWHATAGDTIVLNWNREETLRACEAFDKKRDLTGREIKTLYLPISGWSFLKDLNKLESIIEK